MLRNGGWNAEGSSGAGDWVVDEKEKEGSGEERYLYPAASDDVSR